MSYLKIGKYYGDNDSLPVYQFKETLDTDYLDISNVTHWYGAQDFANKDYLFCRTGSIGYMDNNGGFSALSLDEKQLMAQNFCVSKTDRDTLYTDAEQEAYWDSFVKNSQQARQERWDKTKSFVSYRLSISDSNQLADETFLLNNKYIYYGIESFAVDGVDGIFDWINGTASFSGSGFPSKSYYDESLKQGILDCLNGI